MFVFIITVKFNINMAFLKLALLIAGDIGSNPGPTDYKIQKSILGSFHQGHSKFGVTAGIQCSCIALYAICFSIVKKVSVWKTFDLDYILENGDAKFKLLNIHRLPFLLELPNNIVSESQNIIIELLGTFYGILSQNDIFAFHKRVAPADVGNGLIFMTDGYTFSIIWSKNSFFLFDSHSRDVNGCIVGEGGSVLLMF